MDPVTVDSFLTLAPAAMVIAVGAKVGLGPGVSVPISAPVRDSDGKLVFLPQTKSVADRVVTWRAGRGTRSVTQVLIRR